jgi:Yersinia/Haemophilus virulence surface antigen
VFQKDKDEGTEYCLRATTKWAACEVVQAPFKHRGLNVEKTQAKHTAYVTAHENAGQNAMRDIRAGRFGTIGTKEEGERIVNAATSKASDDFVKQWLAKFTTGDKRDKTVHRNAVEAGELVRSDPSLHFADEPLQPGHAALTVFDKMAGDEHISAHVVACSADSNGRVKLFDANFGEMKYRGSAFGPDLKGFLEAHYVGDLVDNLRYKVTRLKPQVAATQSSQS